MSKQYLDKDGVTYFWNKIKSYISVFTDSTITFNQTNSTVLEFIQEAQSIYTEDNYSTTVVTKYGNSTENHDDPVGLTLNFPQSGTLVLEHQDNALFDWNMGVSVGENTIYNLIPNSIYSYKLNGTNIAGKIRATGIIRQVFASTGDNCRDLGGRMANGGRVRYGYLYRGADLRGNTEFVSTMTNVCKIKHEIDLQEQNNSNSSGISMFGSNVTYNRYSLDGNAAYIDHIDLSKTAHKTTANALKKIMECAIAKEPTYIHCSIGRDRTGTVCYMLEALLGMSAVDCDIDYELTTITGYVWTNSAVANGGRPLLKGIKEYLATIDSTSNEQAAIKWCVKAGISYDLINKFRRAMIDGTPSVAKSEASSGQYMIATVLRNVTLSNTNMFIDDGESYSTSIIVDDGYSIDSVTVVMGGIILPNAYSNGTISIGSVSGNISITAVAVKGGLQPAFTNALATAVDGNGNIFNGVGFENGKYASASDGFVNSSDSGFWVSGFMPADTEGVPIYIKGWTWSTASHSRFYHYTSENAVIYKSPLSGTGSQSTIGTYWNVEILDSATNYVKLTPTASAVFQMSTSNAVKWRISMPGTGDDVIISIGNPIEYVNTSDEGTTVVEYKPSFAQGTSTGGNKSTSSGTITQITLDNLNSSSDSQYSLSSGGIKVNEEGLYKVSGSVYLSGSSTHTYSIGCFIKKGTSFANSTEIMATQRSSIIGGQVSTTPKMISLNSGDVVYLCARTQGFAGTITQNNAATFLLLEKVK